MAKVRYSWTTLIGQVKSLERKNKRREFLSLTESRVRFCEGAELTRELEFDPDHSAKAVREPGLKGWDYDEVPWHEQEEEEIPWWEYPDLEADDELTALCKKVINAGDYDKKKGRAAKIEAKVITFVVNLKNKWLKRKKEEHNNRGGNCSLMERKTIIKPSVLVNDEKIHNEVLRRVSDASSIKCTKLVSSASDRFKGLEDEENNHLGFKKPDWVTSPPRLRRTESGDALRTGGRIGQPITPSTYERNRSL